MSEPFLPEPEATSAPAPASVFPFKQYGVRALVLWAVLIVMFLTIWQFLTPSTREAARPVTRSCVESASDSSSLTLAILPGLACVVLVTLLFLRLFRYSATFAVSQEPGRLAMARGRFSEAAELFRAQLARHGKQPNYHAASLVTLAEAQLRAGHLDGVLATCRDLDRTQIVVFGPTFKMRVSTLTALTYGLRGDVPLAERWVEEGRARLRKNQEDRLGQAAWLCLAEAILACRKNAPEAAIKLLDARWSELRFSLTGDMMRVVEVVRAFAEAQGSDRAQNTVAERLIRVEPVVPGEFAFLGVEWAEMRVFLETHLAPA